MVLHYHGSLSSGKLDRHQSPVGTSACRISKPTWHGADSHISRLKHHKKEKKHGLTSYKPARNQLQIGMSSPKSSGICIYIYIYNDHASLVEIGPSSAGDVSSWIPQRTHGLTDGEMSNSSAIPDWSFVFLIITCIP